MTDNLNWYEFTQNNSGGSFVTNESLCHRLFIQAETDFLAIKKAESLGVYFNGCDEGIDCECCGDRWHTPWHDVEFPLQFSSTERFDTVEEYAQVLADSYGWTIPDVRLFYADGTIAEIFTKGRKE